MATQLPDVGAFTFTVKDDDLAQSKMTFYAVLPVLNQWTQDGAKAFIDALWALVTPLIDSALVGFNFTMSGYEDTFPDAAAGSDVEDKGVFLMRTENNKPTSVALASILEAKLVSSGIAAGIQIDTSDSDVADFIDALENGIDLNPFGILDVARISTDRGEAVARVVDAYKQNRQSHKSRGGRG